MEDYATLEHKIRTYSHSTDNKTLTREEETEIFGYLRGLQKEMLQEVASLDGNILREALGKYARVEEYFSKEQIDSWDHYNEILGYVRKPRYQQYLMKERKLKCKETKRAQYKLIEWYRQDLSRECFVEICNLYLDRLKKSPFTNGELKEKQAQFKDGTSKIDGIYSALIHLNHGLVRVMYRQLSPIIRLCISDGVDEAEIVQGGNMGLVTAIDQFDPLRGNKFATYAAWWVRSGIKCVLLNSSESFRALSNYHRRNRREGEERQLSPEQLEEFRALSAFLHTVPLNAPVRIRDENSNRDLIDILPDRNSPNPEEIVLAAELPQFIEQVLSEAVSARERDVLKRIYEEEQTGVDIGRDYDCSGSNVQRIHAEAIKKLRKYFRKKELCDMLS